MATMKAWQFGVFSGKLEDSLIINEAVPVPSHDSIAKGHLLVQIIAASLNPVDYKLPESGFMGRLMLPRPATPGIDFCGRVVAKHESDDTFHNGQLVFGGFPGNNAMGTLGQYSLIPSACCAPLPEGVDPDEAAAVGTAATTAYQSLMPDSLQPGAKIFINGGSGGVGTWAIQLAKAMGAEVSATCSTANVDLCRNLGADEVVDYKQVDLIADLKARGPIFDLIIDNVGNDPELYNKSNLFLKPGGTFVQVGIGEAMSFGSVASTIGKQIWPSVFSGRKFYFVNMKNSTEFFNTIGNWMSEGKVTPVIAARYPWEEAPEAFRRLRGGHVAGKIVIKGCSSS